MFTEAPRASSSSSDLAISATSVTWWWPPQLSNQPFQNSEHISGPVGWCRRSRSRRSFTREPKDAVLCSSGRLPFSIMSSSGWSTVISGTVMPMRSVSSVRALR